VSDNTYRVIEIVGTSSNDVSEAIRNGIARAASTLDELDWFEVTQTRGHIENGEVAHFQVHLKVGFKLRQ
jgi:flavin-binding protein dodecin